jgi:hypothetical protein
MSGFMARTPAPAGACHHKMVVSRRWARLQQNGGRDKMVSLRQRKNAQWDVPKQTAAFRKMLKFQSF